MFKGFKPEEDMIGRWKKYITGGRHDREMEEIYY